MQESGLSVGRRDGVETAAKPQLGLEMTISDGEFLTGSSPTVADCTLFAIFQTSRERFDLTMGSTHARLDGWYTNFRKRPSADF